MAAFQPASTTTARSSSTPKEHRHFDHGYAVTSHSSQGLTAERVLVNADTGVHPDLLNSRFGYVSISRASHEATLFTDDMAKLSPQLSSRCLEDLRSGIW
jgi:ATP-dependent exoDNAse (exonuclease V) alpha subunit